MVTRLPELQTRQLVTVFGEFAIPVHVYGARPGQKIELRPTEQRLALPESEISYLLQDWDQLLGMEQAFGVVKQTLQTILGLNQPVDTLERGNRQMAEAAPTFRESQPFPDPKQEGKLLVVTEDNKGVPMVRPVDERGRWWADLSPVSGPTLGPFAKRGQALDAKARWLRCWMSGAGLRGSLYSLKGVEHAGCAIRHRGNHSTLPDRGSGSGLCGSRPGSRTGKEEGICYGE
ncbi:MAG: hypothetical protein ABSH20_18250 [Tepidisphaeraceae bacterium]